MHNKKAIVVISFGSTFDDTRTKDIGGIEAAIANAFPAYDQYRAFTSNIIRKRLAARGIMIDDPKLYCKNSKSKAIRKFFCNLLIYYMEKNLNKKFLH